MEAHKNGLAVASVTMAFDVLARVFERSGQGRISMDLAAAALAAFMLWLDSDGQRGLEEDPELFKY